MAVTQETQTVSQSTESAHVAENDVLGTLGIDGTLFIAQLVNFTIVAFVLWRWVFKPVVKKLDERTSSVEKGLKDAEEAQKRLENAEKEERTRVATAERKAQSILVETQKLAETMKAEKLAETKAEMDKAVEAARALIKNERKETYDALRKDIAGLIIVATEKVVRGLDPEARQRLVTEALNEFEKNDV